MAKKIKTVDVVKAFGSSIEEATTKLLEKKKGFCILHPEFNGAELMYDAGTFEKDGKTMAWAKLFQEVEVDEEAVANHPEMKQKKPAAKKPSKKAKVA